jgi:hypothetical protein
MATETYTSWRAKFNQMRDVDLPALEKDIGRLDERVAAVEAEVESKRRVLDELREDRDALQGFRNFLVHGRPAAPVTAQVTNSIGIRTRVSGRRGGRREAIVGLFEGQPLHASAIRNRLVDANVTDSSDSAYHSLQVTLSQMYRAGILDRVSRGVYQLASPNGDDPDLRSP